MEKNRKITSGNTIVDRMLDYSLSESAPGAYIPFSWYKTIKSDKGKTYHIACSILAEIVYWYTPKIEVDDNGQIITIKKRFRDDLLQKSYNDLADRHEITKTQATHAIVRLEKLGVVERIFRSIMVGGTKVANVLYLRLDVDRLREITYPDGLTESFSNEDNTLYKDNRGIILNKDTSVHKVGDVSNPDINSVIPNKHTNTDNTTFNTKDITTSSTLQAQEGDAATLRDLVASNIRLSELKKNLPDSIATIDMVYRTICNVYSSGQKTYYINNVRITAADIQDTFLHQLGKCEIEYAIGVIQDHIQDNPTKMLSESYVRTVLYNAPVMAQACLELKTNHKSKQSNRHIKNNRFINFSQSDIDLDALVAKKYPGNNIINKLDAVDPPIRD